MPVRKQRRGVLELFSLLVVTPAGGCLTGSERSGGAETDGNATATETPTVETPVPETPTVETPAPGSCDTVDHPLPETPAGEARPREYPAFPATVSADTVSSFARAYESAIQVNRFIRANDTSNLERVSVQNVSGESARQFREGFLLGVDGELDWERGSVLGDRGFGAWYYVTERFAVRHEVEGLIHREWPASLTPSEVVACQ
jgi:hypothetical protein